jgi:tight adherence protein C
MIFTIAAITFLATLAFVLLVVYAFSPARSEVAERLGNLWRAQPSAKPEQSKLKDTTEVIEASVAKVGRLLPLSPDQASRTEIQMIRAGFRNPSAVMVMRGMKVLFPLLLIAIVVSTRLYTWNPPFVFIITLLLGYFVPELYLSRKINQRQSKLRKGLPDALDLLVICVEAGLALDQALLRVSQELNIAHPELSQELQLVNLEMRVGKTRLEALRALGQRTGVEDVKALVAMLVQADRFGTSVAQSLRVHSDDLRVKRRQRAEEMAAKTTVKMVPPLVFFIFPALMVVILGPAFISLMRQLMPALGK